MSKISEEIVRVQVLDDNQLQIVLEGDGRPEYQYIYREAKGVYWDDGASAFKGTPRREWSFAKWFRHILEVCSDVGVSLRLGPSVEWVAVPDADRKEIEAQFEDGT